MEKYRHVVASAVRTLCVIVLIQIVIDRSGNPSFRISCTALHLLAIPYLTFLKGQGKAPMRFQYEKVG